MIRVDQLSKRYGSTVAVDHLSLNVPVGSVLGLLGPNGAGKSTFLKLVMGYLFPDGGRIDRGGLSPRQIGFLPDQPFYPARFKVGEYLSTLGRLAGLQGARLRTTVDRLLGQLELSGVADRRLSACSKGMLQRLGIAQALLSDPPLLLLDEPVLGLDPAGQKFIRDLIQDLHRSGKTVVLSSHNLGEVTRVCTDVAMLNRGRLVRSGRLDAVLPPRAEVTITTGPMPDELPARLAALGEGMALADRRIILTGDAILLKVPVLLTLMEAGVDIRDLNERQATLEEIYLEATGE